MEGSETVAGYLNFAAPLPLSLTCRRLTYNRTMATLFPLGNTSTNGGFSSAEARDLERNLQSSSIHTSGSLWWICRIGIKFMSGSLTAPAAPRHRPQQTLSQKHTKTSYWQSPRRWHTTCCLDMCMNAVPPWKTNNRRLPKKLLQNLQLFEVATQWHGWSRPRNSQIGGCDWNWNADMDLNGAIVFVCWNVIFQRILFQLLHSIWIDDS